MRTTLLPRPGRRRCATNLSRKQPRVRVFEVGRVLRGATPTATRSRCASAASRSGQRCPSNGASAARAVDFFDVKGDLEALAAPLALATTRARASGAAPRAQRARCASTATRVGLARRAAPAPVRALRAAGGAGRVRARPRGAARRRRCRRRAPVSRLPVGAPRPRRRRRRKHCRAGDVLDAMRRRERRRSRDRSTLFDVYRGHGLPRRQEKRCDSGAYAGY